MKAKVFSFVSVSENSIVASVRIARFISEQLGIPVCDDESIAEEPLDILIFVNGAFSYCKCRDALASMVLTTPRIVWVQQDYTIYPPSISGTAETPFRKAFRDRIVEKKMPKLDMWTTITKNQNATPFSHYINWNTLTLENADDKTVTKRRAMADDYLLYYGSYREFRQDAFDRFFTRPAVRTVISSPSNKFSDRYQDVLIKHVKKFDGDIYDRIGMAGLGLCVEDSRSHHGTNFHSPPNRFYEMLSAGLPMVVQHEMAPSLRRGGYDPAPWVVRSAIDIKERLARREEIAAAQRQAWLAKARDEHRATTARLHAAWAMLTDKG